MDGFRVSLRISLGRELLIMVAIGQDAAVEALRRGFGDRDSGIARPRRVDVFLELRRG